MGSAYLTSNAQQRQCSAPTLRKISGEPFWESVDRGEVLGTNATASAPIRGLIRPRLVHCLRARTGLRGTVTRSESVVFWRRLCQLVTKAAAAHVGSCALTRAHACT